jgi:hypothetical protein
MTRYAQGQTRTSNPKSASASLVRLAINGPPFWGAVSLGHQLPFRPRSASGSSRSSCRSRRRCRPLQLYKPRKCSATCAAPTKTPNVALPSPLAAIITAARCSTNFLRSYSASNGARATELGWALPNLPINSSGYSCADLASAYQPSSLDSQFNRRVLEFPACLASLASASSRRSSPP